MLRFPHADHAGGRNGGRVVLGALLTDADARAAVAELPADSAVAMVAWENTWAIKAGMALRRKGAVLLGFERIPS